MLLSGATHVTGDSAAYPAQCVPHPVSNCEIYTSDAAAALGTAFTFNSVSS